MQEPEFPRRLFLAGSGLAVFTGLGLPRDAAAAEWSDAEKRNVELVKKFCATWSTRDLTRVTALMADDSVYRMSETAPPLTGHAALIGQLQPWMESSSSIEFRILETFAKGPIVMTHRIDHFASETRPLTWEGVGVFWVRDDKIQEWSDYTMEMKRE
jgi:limonene-1,2-epoxide hydrolase